MSANPPSATRVVLVSIAAQTSGPLTIDLPAPEALPFVDDQLGIPAPPQNGGAPGAPGAPDPSLVKPVVKPPPLKGPKSSYLSKVFKDKITPDMFDQKGMPDTELAGLCTRFNYVMKQAGDKREVVLANLGLNKGQTGHYDVTKLAADTDRIWKELYRLRDEEEKVAAAQEGRAAVPQVPPSIPSNKEIEQSAIGWKAGSGVDSIKQHRPPEIGGTVKLDLDHPKQALVKAEALATANEQLERSGSFIRLESAGKPDKDGFVKIRPVFRTEKALTARHDESHDKLVKLNEPRQKLLGAGDTAGADDQYVSWADCHRTAQTIMGSEDNASGIGDSERVVMKGLDTLVAPVPKSRIKEITYASDHGANRAMHGFFAAAMPKLFAKLDEKQKKGDKLTAVETEAVRLITEQMKNTSDAPKNYRAVYSKLSSDPAIAKEFAEMFGVNEAIVPKVGTAFAQINDEYEKESEDTKEDSDTTKKDLWNFHFAGVVLVNKDGSYMTLENLSVEDTAAVNDNWYFAVYDPKTGKSFHEVNKNDSHVGKSPMTLLFDKAPTA